MSRSQKKGTKAVTAVHVSTSKVVTKGTYQKLFKGHHIPVTTFIPFFSESAVPWSPYLQVYVKLIAQYERHLAAPIN